MQFLDLQEEKRKHCRMSVATSWKIHVPAAFALSCGIGYYISGSKEAKPAYQEPM